MSDRFLAATLEAQAVRKAGVALDRIILHTMEGSYEGSIRWATYSRQKRAESFAARNGGTVEKWLASSLTFPTAAHYYVSRSGEATQMVPDEKKAVHANDYNSRSIGIEHEAHAAVNDFPAAMMAKSAKMTAALCKKFGIPMDRDHIIGHAEVPGATHTDPGIYFPWTDYIDLVRAA